MADYELRCWLDPASGRVCGCTASGPAALLPFQAAGAPGRGVLLSTAFETAPATGSLLLRACPVRDAPPPRGEPCPPGAVERRFRVDPTWAALDPDTGCTVVRVANGAGAEVPTGAAMPGRYSYEPAVPVYALRLNAR